jgi:hypothetical protein
MKHATSFYLIGVLAALAMNGCLAGAPAEGSAPEGSTDENTGTTEQEAQLTLLAEVNLEHDRQVKFYDFEGVGISIVETGRAEYVPHELKSVHIDAAEYYESLTGKAVPPALMQAVERSKTTGAIAADGPVVSSDVAETVVPTKHITPSALLENGQVGKISQALTYDEWKATYCAVSDTYEAPWTDVNTNGSFQWPHLSGFQTSAIALTGPIHYVVKVRPNFTWLDQKITDLAAGRYAWVSYANFFNSFDAKASVTDTTGATYSFCSHGSRGS